MTTIHHPTSINPAPSPLITDINKIHEECKNIFQSLLINSKTGQSFACNVYEKLVEDGDCEDCLGENFNQLIHKINNNWFHSFNPTSDWDFYFNNYCLLLYLFVERVNLVFSILNKDGSNSLFADYHKLNFKTLAKINKWANFIKHPKEFLFTHWPTYYFEGMEVSKNEGDITIDTPFVFKNYSNETQRPEILGNNNKVFVEIPNLLNLTESFCIEMNRFFDFICKNQIVADYLKKKSTIKNFFEPDTIISANAEVYFASPESNISV